MMGGQLLAAALFTGGALLRRVDGALVLSRSCCLRSNLLSYRYNFNCNNRIIVPSSSSSRSISSISSLNQSAAAVDDTFDKESTKSKKKVKQKLLRVDRLLSNRGLASRKQAAQLVKEQRVEYVDSATEELILIQKVTQKLPEDVELIVDGYVVESTPLLLVYNKPKGMLSAMKDSSAGWCLGDALDPMLIKAGLHPVGRLDQDTSGLILFSSDGTLTQRLLHPRYVVEKEYVATVENTVDTDLLKEKLTRGVETGEGVHVAKLLDVSCDDVDELTCIRLVVTEGKHRMVRRMLANCGHPVVDLRRDRLGPILLHDLEEGEFRDLSEDETAWAYSLLQ